MFKIRIVELKYEIKCFYDNCERNIPYLEEQYHDARFLRLVMMEFPNARIEIGNEISDTLIEKYDKMMHTEIFPPINPLDITELSGDGNEKIMIKT